MWFYLALLSSLSLAVSAVAKKKAIQNMSVLTLTWITLVISTPIIIPFAIKEIPQINPLFILGVTSSVVLYLIGKVFGFKAIRMANLSTVYPLVSLGPVITLVLATFPPLSEMPQPLAILGLAITMVGAYLLNIAQAKTDLLAPFRYLFKQKATFYALIAIMLDSVVVLFDKLAINNTSPQNTSFTLLVENLLVIIGLIPLLYVRVPQLFSQIRLNIPMLIIVGLLNAISTLASFSAMGSGNVAIVSALTRTHLLIVLLLSNLIFHDKPHRSTVFGSIIMIIGVILIKFGS